MAGRSCEGCGRMFVSRDHRQRFCDRKCYDEKGRRRPQCSIEGCTEFSHGKGLCGSHYQKMSRYGDPLAAHRKRPNGTGRGVCVLDGCDREVSSRGLCELHYRRVLHHDTTDPPPEQCPVCTHSDRAVIEYHVMAGVPTKRVASWFGLHGLTIRRHMERDAGFPVPGRPTGKPCQVCTHPDVDEIDRLLEQRLTYDRHHPVSLPGHLTFKAIGLRFGFEGLNWFRNHITPEHQAKRAVYELGRLEALTSGTNGTSGTDG